MSPRFVVERDELVEDGKCRALLSRRYVGTYLSDYVGRVFMKSWLAQRLYDLAYQTNLDDKIHLYMTLIREMQRLARERPQCLILAFNKAEAAYFADTRRNNDNMIARLRSDGIEVADVSLAETIEDLDPAYYIAGDGHPSDLANQRRAEILSKAADACHQVGSERWGWAPSRPADDSSAERHAGYTDRINPQR